MARSKKGQVTLFDLPPEVQERLLEQEGNSGGRKPRSMTADQVRGLALRVLGVLADRSTQAERKRILRKAVEINEV